MSAAAPLSSGWCISVGQLMQTQNGPGEMEVTGTNALVQLFRPSILTLGPT